MSDENQPEAPEVAFAFAEGEEVILFGHGGLPAKILTRLVGPDRTPLYEVVYAARETLREDELAPKAA
jgi:hypothetical protein